MPALFGTISQSIGAGAGGGGGAGDDLVMPAGVPAPLVWFTPRHVEVDGGGGVTKFLNQGSTGATNDATPETANLATITQPASWGGKDVITLADTATGGYNFGNVAEGRTIISLTTYKDGLDVAFDGYDALVSDGVGSSNQITGKSGVDYFFFTEYTYFFDGVNVGGAQPAFLPADKKSVASTYNGTFSAVGSLFYDKDFDSRNWKGTVGDVLIFQSILTDGQISDIHDAMVAFYAVAAVVEPVTFTTQTKLAGGGSGDFIMTFPADIASGDFLMAVLSGDSTAGANPFTTPAGWALEFHQGSTGSDSTLSIYTKVADGSETGTIVFGTELTMDQVGTLFRVADIDATGIEVIGPHLFTAGSIAFVPSMTTVTDNSLVFAMVGFDGGDSGGFTVSAPYEMQTNLEIGDGTGVSQGIAMQTMATAGATGNAVFNTVSGALDGIVGVQIALKPAA